MTSSSRWLRKSPWQLFLPVYGQSKHHRPLVIRQGSRRFIQYQDIRLKVYGFAIWMIDCSAILSLANMSSGSVFNWNMSSSSLVFPSYAFHLKGAFNCLWKNLQEYIMGNGHVLAQWDFLMHNGKPQLFRLLYGNMFFFAIE